MIKIILSLILAIYITFFIRDVMELKVVGDRPFYQAIWISVKARLFCLVIVAFLVVRGMAQPFAAIEKLDKFKLDDYKK
jgi:hypothetical protein